MLSGKYAGIAENDTQYMLVDIQVCTQNFTLRGAKRQREMNHIKSLYNATQQENAAFSPIDNFGKQLIEEYKLWLKVSDKVKKALKWVGVGVAAAAVVAFGVSCFVPNTQAAETESGLTITARPDNDSYGMFKKWGIDFHARELVEGTSEYETASILLKNESEKYHIFDISMVSGSNIVQPNEPVRIEVTIPDDYYERNVSIYYISPNGRYESVKCEKVVAGDKRVAVFYAEHFSLYAIAEHPFNIGFSDDGRDIPEQKVMWGKLIDEPEKIDRTGYDFLGWYDGDVKWDFDKMVAYDDITLVGKWRAKEYKLTLDYGDGRPKDDKKVVYDQAYTLSVPARVGYVFLGWYDESSVCLPDSGVWKRTDDTTVYARWELEGYKIHFDACGGELDATEKEKSFTYGERYGTLPTPQRPGYSFAGWYSQPEGGSRIESTTVISMAATHTLYARWNEMSFTVNFISNGGQSVPSQTHKYNDKVSRPGDITREGYEFLGWYKDAACTKAFDFVADVVTADMTLYAKWGRGAITIAFDSKGGSSVDERRISQGDSLGDNLPTPTRTGYTFRGWFADSGCTGDRIYGTTTFTSNTTLYAKWEANTYTIKFDANGGAGSMASIDAVYGVEKKLTSVGFSKSGYDFVGWSTSPEGSATYTNGDVVKNLCTEAKDSVTLYAQWKIKTYTISYVTNGGVISGQTTKYTVYDEAINIPDAVYPTYSEYNYFLGWYENEACTIPVRKDFKSNPADVILYAKWDLCDAYLSIDTTPMKIKGSNPLVTTNQRIIIDWSGEKDTNLLNHTGRDVDGTSRFDYIEIGSHVKEVIFIGSSNKQYSNLVIKFVGFNKNDSVNIVFDNFKFTSSGANAIISDNDKSFTVTFTVEGDCLIAGSNGAGSTVSLSKCDVNIIGEGSFKISGGVSSNSASNRNGSVGITANNLSIDMNGTLDIIGGNGQKSGSTGADGGNGGEAVKVKNITIDGNLTCTMTGGSGADGREGVDGYRGSNKNDTRMSQDGGDGGDGAAALMCDSVQISSDVTITFKGGNGGQGGKGGKGLQGDQGKTGNSAVQNGGNGIYNSKNASDGDPGGLGYNGSNGGNGGSGGVAVKATHSFINNSKAVEIRGGNGGVGGQGGQGGKGGTGGTGGADDYGGIGTNEPGDGGQGGQGGTGGRGGDGGDGAAAWGSVIKVQGEKLTIVDGQGANGGAAGDAGAAGDGGRGGSGGSYDSDGSAGKSGKAGSKGSAGNKGSSPVSNP